MPTADRTADRERTADTATDPKSMRRSRTAEQEEAEHRNGDRPEDADPKSIGKPGRTIPSGLVLCISVVLPDGPLREWAEPMLCDPRQAPVAYDMRL